MHELLGLWKESDVTIKWGRSLLTPLWLTLLLWKERQTSRRSHACNQNNFCLKNSATTEWCFFFLNFLSNCWICAQLKLGRQFSTFWSRWNFGPGVVEAGKLWVSALVWVLEVIIVPYITISVSHPLKAHCLQSDRGIKWIIRGSDSTFCSVTFTPPLFFGFVLRGQQLSRPS